MALPVSVVLHRNAHGTGGQIDLTPLVDQSSLNWSTGIPGGFSSCSFTLNGDFRRLTKEIPYLALIRIIGDHHRVLYEGQVEDKGMVLSGGQLALTVTAMGMQNVLKETSLRRIWSKRDMQWQAISIINGMQTASSAAMTLGNNGWQTNAGQYDPTSPSTTGVQVAAVASSTVADKSAMAMEFKMPIGMTATRLRGTVTNNTAGGNLSAGIWASASGATFGTALAQYTTAGPTDFDIDVTGAAQIRVGLWNSSGASRSFSLGDGVQFYNMRILGTSVMEDVAAVAHDGGGFNAGTLIRDIVAQVPLIGAGTIDRGDDFSIEHLDAGTRRFAYDILNEVASYYARSWAVWENAKLDWVTPNLQEHQWVIPVGQLASLNLDASVVDSQKTAYILYTAAASGREAEQSSTVTDRRNPYVLHHRTKDLLLSEGTLTSGTAAQLARLLLNDVGFGPVPAAGTVSILGETLVRHAHGHAVKAWQIRAGDNVTIPELPMANVFTHDGRGEVLYRIISTQADAGSGTVTLSLDTYGSKRSDVLLARLL